MATSAEFDRELDAMLLQLDQHGEKVEAQQAAIRDMGEELLVLRRIVRAQVCRRCGGDLFRMAD